MYNPAPWSSRFRMPQNLQSNPHQNVDCFLWPSSACGKKLNVGNLFILEMVAMGKLWKTYIKYH